MTIVSVVSRALGGAALLLVATSITPAGAQVFDRQLIGKSAVINRDSRGNMQRFVNRRLSSLPTVSVELCGGCKPGKEKLAARERQRDRQRDSGNERRRAATDNDGTHHFGSFNPNPDLTFSFSFTSPSN